jgi:hypothetical protein
MIDDIKRCYDILMDPDTRQNLILLEIELDKLSNKELRNGLLLLLAFNTEGFPEMKDVRDLLDVNLEEVNETYIRSTHSNFLKEINSYTDVVMNKIRIILDKIMVPNPDWEDQELIDIVSNMSLESYEIMKNELIVDELYEEISHFEKIRNK